MSRHHRYLAALSLFALLPLYSGCDTCGFDCSDDNDNKAEPASLTLKFSDAPLEALTKVVIEVTAIEFRRNDAEAIAVEAFTLSIGGEDYQDAAQFQIDLLDYPGIRAAEILSDFAIDADFYNEIFIAINDGVNDIGDVNRSFVEAMDGTTAPIIVVGDGLSLPGRQIDADNQAITVEFGLARALKFNANSDTYTLDDAGIRIVDDSLAPSLGGSVDPDLFDADDSCTGEDEGDVTLWNRVYLYEGTGLEVDALADVFEDGAEGSGGRIAPFASSPLVEGRNGWEFSFGYVPVNTDGYTLAFSCNAEEDDARDIDEITIPLPAGQIVEVSLELEDNITCEFNFEETPAC